MNHAESKRSDSNDHGAASPTTWQLIVRLLKMGLRHKLQLALALIVTVTMQIMAVGEFVSSGLAIDILRKYADETAPDPQWPIGLEPSTATPFMTLLTFAAGAALIFGLLRAAGYYFGRWTSELLSQSIIVDLRDVIYTQLQRLPFSFYDTHDSGTIINRVITDVQSVRLFIQGVLIRAFTSLATLVVFLAALFSIHVWLTLACLSFVVVQAVVMLHWGKKARPAFRTLRKLTDSVVMKISECVQGIRVVRAFGREKEQTEEFTDQSADARDQRQGIWRMMGNHMPIVQGCTWFSVAVLIGYGGYLVQIGPDKGGIALGSIWVFFGLMRTLATQLEQIAQVAAIMPDALTGAERVFGILDTELDIKSPDLPVTQFSEDSIGEIEFRNVSFGYDPEKQVLNDISFHIKPGETVAIVGPTGSGKTTLLNLITRFYDPQHGQVLVNGIDVREQDLTNLRRSIGFVFQEAYLFSNSIANNVAFGRPESDWDTILAATQNAHANSFVESLDKSFDTIVGERGVTLSGGERQRLSIARAIILEPQILIFDDAMSAVDAGTETQIQNALDSLSYKRTTMVVAHRLSTLRRADRVLVVEDGRITTEGTHDFLMATDGHYREAALVQLEDATTSEVDKEGLA